MVLAARPGPSKLATGSRGRAASARMPTITPLRCATSAALRSRFSAARFATCAGGSTARPTRSGSAARPPGCRRGDRRRGEGAGAELVEDVALRGRVELARARVLVGSARGGNGDRPGPGGGRPRAAVAALQPQAGTQPRQRRAGEPPQAPEARDGADRDLVGVALERRIGLGGARDARVRLLTDVGQLVREQRVADRGAGPVLARRERDVLADRDRPRADLAGDLRARRVVVHAHLGELAAEHAAELRADLGLQRPPAAQLVRERRGIVAIGRRGAGLSLGRSAGPSSACSPCQVTASARTRARIGAKYPRALVAPVAAGTKSRIARSSSGAVLACASASQRESVACAASRSRTPSITSSSTASTCPRSSVRNSRRRVWPGCQLRHTVLGDQRTSTPAPRSPARLATQQA